MNKTELANSLASKVDISKAEATRVVRALFDADDGSGIIASELEAGGKVTIPGFGTFSTRVRAARTGTNPATGESLHIPERRYPTFRPGKTLKERVSD